MTEKKRIELITCAKKLKSFCSSIKKCYSTEHPEDKCPFWHDTRKICILNGTPARYSLGKLTKSDNRLITGDEFRERCKGGLD